MGLNDKRLVDIEEELKSLPQGNVTYKNIRGAKRMYLKGKYIKGSEEKKILSQVARRKNLEEERDAILLGGEYVKFTDEHNIFQTNVSTGLGLLKTTEGVLNYGRRECSCKLREYIESDYRGSVCVVYGLRRTGKTTMVLQEIANLPMAKTAYIKILSSNTMNQLNHDLMILSKSDYKYVFIDEITLMKEFIDSASLLSDVYAMQGMKIVLSGTDSLGLAIASHEELYDRVVTIHTTFIPFREYANLLNIHDVDQYIRYGGTFRMGETAFGDSGLNDDSVSFRDDESTRRYIDTAIAKNIQHSLEFYQDGGHFRHLYDLYSAGELTGAINRIIEDMTHRFLLDVLKRKFESHDLGSGRQIDTKRSAKKGKESVLNRVDSQKITENLMKILEIKDIDSMTVELCDDHVIEIKQYLKMLDLIIDCPSRAVGASSPVENVLFSQPGMRYCQAQALVYFLVEDEAFAVCSLQEKTAICNLILEEVRGRLLEEIVLLETIKALPKNKKAFKLMLEAGEIDMVVADTELLTCELYEVKHSTEIDPRQYRHLVDEEKCNVIEHSYGKIVSKNVIYRGDDYEVDGINYLNVERYLENIC